MAGVADDHATKMAAQHVRDSVHAPGVLAKNVHMKRPRAYALEMEVNGQRFYVEVTKV